MDSKPFNYKDVDKQTIIKVDDEPTLGSTNPVSSAGVAKALNKDGFLSALLSGFEALLSGLLASECWNSNIRW